MRYRSLITVYHLKTKTAKTVFTADQTWQAPNWTPDGKYLIANMGGDLYRIPTCLQSLTGTCFLLLTASLRRMPIQRESWILCAGSAGSMKDGSMSRIKKLLAVPGGGKISSTSPFVGLLNWIPEFGF